jgi:hypothetical protein
MNDMFFSFFFGKTGRGGSALIIMHRARALFGDTRLGTVLR